MKKRMRKKKRLEREIWNLRAGYASLRQMYGSLLARVTLLEESQVALVRENTMLKDRLATFESINEDNVVVANDKFASLEKEVGQLRKEMNKLYLQKKPWWKR